MWDVARKSTEETLKLEKYLKKTFKSSRINLKVDTFSSRDAVLEKIQRVVDLFAEFLNLIDKDNDVMTEEILSTKFFIFTKTKHNVKSVSIRSYSGSYFSECGKMWARITRNTDTFHAAKLLITHGYIEEHHSSNLQQFSKCSSENNTGTTLLSVSFNKIKLPEIKNRPFDGQLDLWKRLSIILNVLLTNTLL